MLNYNKPTDFFIPIIIVILLTIGIMYAMDELTPKRRRRKFIKKVRPLYQNTILDSTQKIGTEFTTAIIDYLYSDDAMQYYIQYNDFHKHLITHIKHLYEQFKQEIEFNREVEVNKLYESLKSRDQQDTPTV